MNSLETPASKHLLRALALTISFLLVLNQCSSEAFAQAASSSSSSSQLPSPQQAPIPPQIAAAHSIFLVNDGADANFPVDAQIAYNDVYAALQAWGHYQLVTSPADADLIFDLRDIAPVVGVAGDANNVYSISGPAFRLSIKDPKTNVTIWTTNSPVEVVGRSAVRARWFNIAVTNLVSRVKVLANEPLTETETADLTLQPRFHGHGLAIGLFAITAGVAVASTLILKHEFNQNVANQHATACAQNPFFCTNTP